MGFRSREGKRHGTDRPGSAHLESPGRETEDRRHPWQVRKAGDSAQKGVDLARIIKDLSQRSQASGQRNEAARVPGGSNRRQPRCYRLTYSTDLQRVLVEHRRCLSTVSIAALVPEPLSGARGVNFLWGLLPDNEHAGPLGQAGFTCQREIRPLC